MTDILDFEITLKAAVIFDDFFPVNMLNTHKTWLTFSYEAATRPVAK